MFIDCGVYMCLIQKESAAWRTTLLPCRFLFTPITLLDSSRAVIRNHVDKVSEMARQQIAFPWISSVQTLDFMNHPDGVYSTHQYHSLSYKMSS
jgi:hypothetical protein